MKKLAIYGIILLSLLNADEISASIQEAFKGDFSAFCVSTNAKNNQCSITINNKVIYQRKCEYEYEPRLVFMHHLEIGMRFGYFKMFLWEMLVMVAL